MARPRIKVTSDSGFTTTGNRTVAWEIFDATAGTTLSSASEPLAATTLGSTATRQAKCIRDLLDSRIDEYLTTNTYTEPEYLTVVPAGTSSTSAVAGNDARLSDARSPTAHTHPASDIASGLIATARLGSGATAANFLRGDQTYAAPSGGSDPWTYVVLASDFITSSGTAVDVTGMNFTPSANLRYEIEGKFMLRTATATVGARPGCAWPTGMTDGAVWIWAASSATALVGAMGNINAAVLCANTGHANTTQSWPSQITGMLLAGASPSGTFKIQLATETAGTNATMKANSFFRWRTF